MEKYFAVEEAETTVQHLHTKAQEWFNYVLYNKYLDKIRRSWQAYHGVFYEDSHAVSFGGEQGELVNLAVNHYRNLSRHILVMVTATRPAFQARSVNTDKKSQIQTYLANGLLDYYMREKRLERYLKTAVEYAIVMGSGYIKMEWNSTSGEIYDYIEPSAENIVDYNEDNEPLDENGNVIEPVPVYEGDVEFKNLSPFDVVFDSSKETTEQHDWVLCRSFLNKYDIAAKYPELRERILGVETKTQSDRRRLTITPYDETVDVPIYEFFHKRTESVPEGRYIMYVGDDIILEDTILIYKDLPVYRIAPAEILGTPYGYTDMFDLLPLQDAVNSLYSTILTNQNAFGVQNIINPRGNDVKVNQLEGSLNFIEYNSQAGKPEPLQLTNTPGEVFNFLQMLENAMETISGVNSVARGSPESSLKSGNALALVQSQALQFISGLQQSYIQLLEDVGTGLINLLKDFASTPRVAAITGLRNRTKIKEFTGEDLSSINRVIVDVGNALAQSTAGREQIASNLLQMGAITSPEKYLEVLNTGNLEGFTGGEMDELFLVKGENENLMQGDDVIAVATDNHALHIREHQAVLDDQNLRKDPILAKKALAHIQEHISLLRNTDPDLLMILGQQPLGPAGGSPIGQTPMPGVQPQPGANQGVMENTQAQSVAVSDQNFNLPEPAQPAGEEMLGPQPTTPEELLARNT